MKNYESFTPVTKDDFFRLLKGFDWAKSWPKDIDWIEAHNTFVEDPSVPETVGYMRTSSWGAPDEYYVLDRILDEDTLNKIQFENEEKV